MRPEPRGAAKPARRTRSPARREPPRFSASASTSSTRNPKWRNACATMRSSSLLRPQKRRNSRLRCWSKTDAAAAGRRPRSRARCSMPICCRPRKPAKRRPPRFPRRPPGVRNEDRDRRTGVFEPRAAHPHVHGADARGAAPRRDAVAFGMRGVRRGADRVVQRRGRGPGGVPAPGRAGGRRDRRDRSRRADPAAGAAHRRTLPVHDWRAAARRGRTDRRHRDGRAALARSRRGSVPALGNHEDRRAARLCLVPARPAATAEFSVARRAGSGDPGAHAAHRGATRPRHGLAGGDRRRTRSPARRAAGPLHGRARRARRGRGARGLALPARLPETARAHLSESADRSAGGGLSHDSVADRDRLGRALRQGLHERQSGSARVPSRALDRFHLRRGRRGVGAGRIAGHAHPVPVRHCTRALHRGAGAGHFLTVDRWQPHAHLLRVRVRQQRHGRGPAAGGRCAVAARELRRHVDGDPHGGLRYPHVHPFPPETGIHVTHGSLRPHRPPLLLCALLSAGVAASPAQALDGQRAEVADFVAEMADRHGFDREALGTLFTQVETRPAIIEAMSRPAEKVMPWHEYRARFMTERRIRRGGEVRREQSAALETASRASGVPCSVLLAITGVETFYGEMTGSHRVIDALATLAFDYPARSSYFRSELEQFLLMAREESLDPLAPLGSYAGAMGVPQFMPTSFRSYAVDGGGDGHRDLWRDWNDVFASVGNYLKLHGWRAGEPVMVAADVSDARLDGVELTNLD